jgi:hypothetical protein
LAELVLRFSPLLLSRLRLLGSLPGRRPAETGVQRNRLSHINESLPGEGFNFGEVANNAFFVNASQVNLYGTGAQGDYQGQPTGYGAAPIESINYASVHDNQTLFDAVQLKSPLSDSLDQRVRRQNLAMSLIALGQGVPFFLAGDDLLRSKSMDKNSYNSGDWFNRLDFTYQANNWGVELPIQTDNGSDWPIEQPLLADSRNPSGTERNRQQPGVVPGVIAHTQLIERFPDGNARGNPGQPAVP